jgi:hypothetical protein
LLFDFNKKSVSLKKKKKKGRKIKIIIPPTRSPPPHGLSNKKDVRGLVSAFFASLVFLFLFNGFSTRLIYSATTSGSLEQVVAVEILPIHGNKKTGRHACSTG